MKIETIRLQNFRNFDDTTIALGDRTFLAGLNGAGKSTVIDAISWAIRGVCRGTDARGAGAKDLIRLGEDSASVTITLAGIGPITRSISRNGGGGSTMKTDAILARLDTTDAAIESVLYGRTFFALHHGDAKDLLLKILNVRIPVEDLPGVNLTEPADLDTLDFLYKAAFENRAAGKKALAAVFVPDLPKVVALGHDPDMLTVQANQARAKERETVAALGRLTADLHTTVVARQKLQPANAGELSGKASVHRDLLSAEVEKSVQASATVKTLQDGRVLSAAELGAKIGERETLIAKIQGHAPDRGCVLNAAIPCQTDAKLFLAQVKDLKTQVKNLKTDVKAADALAQALAVAFQKRTDADRAAEYHRTQLGQIETALANADETDEQISRLDAERVRLDLEIDAAKKTMADAVIATNDLATQAQAAAAYQNARLNRQGAEDKRARLAAEVERMDALVTVLGPNGVRLKALGQAVADFESAINVALVQFGFRMAFSIDPWRVEVLQGDGSEGDAWLPFSLLSDGEKLWSSVCFQQALAAVTGLDFVALDATETVVGENRATLTRMIMKSPVGQILIAMAKGEAEPLPDLDGLTVITFGDDAGEPA